jgi:hypothetical protein
VGGQQAEGCPVVRRTGRSVSQSSEGDTPAAGSWVDGGGDAAIEEGLSRGKEI